MTLPPDRIPVIAGIGEITDRSKEFAAALEPLSLMAEAARRADAETRGLLRDVDSVDIVGLVSWRYESPTAELSAVLGVQPRRAVYGDVGGESPVRFLHEAAQRIARGESDTALVLGAEAQYAVNNAKRANAELPWTPYAVNAPRFRRAAAYVHPLAIRMGVAWPVNVYPFYEIAAAHAWGQTPAQAQEETGRIWSAYSKVAAENPYAWLPKALTPTDITTPTADNRYISWPYTKRMVANPNVNQGAAVIITSLAKARAAGAPLNNHMTHAACAMVRRIRDGARNGLLYGQGEFVTKHYGLTLANEPVTTNGTHDITEDAHIQRLADPRLGDVRPVDETPNGLAELETFTVIYDHAGQPTHAVILARMPGGARTVARSSNPDEIAFLTKPDRFPVGAEGHIHTGPDGLPEWRVHA